MDPTNRTNSSNNTKIVLSKRTAFRAADAKARLKPNKREGTNKKSKNTKKGKS
jgi:hypothetical protein